MFKVDKKHLYTFNAMIWGVPGLMVTTKGVRAYYMLNGGRWWMYIITIVVFFLFSFMFDRIVKKYCDRIAALEGDIRSLFDGLSLKGYILIGFMIGLGITLKLIPGIPAEFFATFYCGLGPALILAAVKFMVRK